MEHAQVASLPADLWEIQVIERLTGRRQSGRSIQAVAALLLHHP
jgi:hypothetical protein